MPVPPTSETEAAFQEGDSPGGSRNRINQNNNPNSETLAGQQTPPPPPSQSIVDERDDISSPMSTSAPLQPSLNRQNNQKNDAASTSFLLNQTKKSAVGTAAAETQWPCANCHAMVSQDRCPFCHGIQVKIYNKNEVRTLPEQAWIERVSPTTIRGGTPLSLAANTTSTTPQFPKKSLVQRVINLDSTTIGHDDSAHQNRELLVEINDEDDDEEELLEQTSSAESFASPARQHPPHQQRLYNNENELENVVEHHHHQELRPNNPVAFLLATAESPLPTPTTHSTLKTLDQLPEHAREELKKQSKERVVVEGAAGGAEKKQRILFAMS